MPADDFRFLSGHFRVHHQRLEKRLVRSDEWATFDMELWGYPVMDGASFVDEMHGTMDGKDFWGMTHRIYDPAQKEWSLYWSDTWSPGLCPPMRGKFEDGTGEFLGHDVEDGRPVLVRFTWTHTDGPLPRWEQAFSTNNGKTWETNWIMEFERIPDSNSRHPDRAF